jgi:hypothetical protein
MTFFRDVWVGFWQAAAFFFRCMAEGFHIIARFCLALTGEAGNG